MRRYQTWKLLVIGIVPLCGGCSSHISEAEDSVRQHVRDPDALEFRNVEERNGIVCGELNGKNPFGGYVGYSPFSYDPADKKVIMTADGWGDPVDARCRTA